MGNAPRQFVALLHDSNREVWKVNYVDQHEEQVDTAGERPTVRKPAAS